MEQIFESAVNYSAGGKTHRGLRLQSPDKTARANVVLLPDWRGVSPLARAHAAYLLSLGCITMIADLYGDGFSPDSPDQVGPMVKHLLDHREQGAAALAAGVAALRENSPDLPVLCLGYSAGGMIAIDYGRLGGDVAGIITCSALLKTAEPGMATRIVPPVLILQGTQDQISPVSVISDLIAEMDAAGNDVRFELFSQTQHAFDNPEAGSDPNARLCYSELSANRARSAIAAFIRDIV